MAQVFVSKSGSSIGCHMAQLFIDIHSDPFMIKNKPVVYTVPTTGEIQVLGTRDGGGGITYAVHYEVNGTTYFNGTDVGDGNLYTLIRE